MLNYWLYEVLLALIGIFGVLVIVSRSPINSVIFLAGMYLAGGGVFILLDHYFIGLTLVIVYVGAIAILFLFTIFMINVRLTLQLGSFASPITALLLLTGFTFYFIFFANFNLAKDLPFLSSFFGNIASSIDVNQSLFNPAWENNLRSIYGNDWSHLLARPSDLTMLANIIFHAYPLALILVGFLLLVVMVAIIKVHLDTH